MNPSSNRRPRSFFIAANAAKIAGLGLVLGSFAGCATDDSGPLGTLVNASVESSPVAPRAAATEVVVPQAPPASKREAIMDRPSPMHVWVTGYWVWKDSKYEWLAGHWELPPRGTDSWVAPRWEKRGEGYAFSEGFWR